MSMNRIAAWASLVAVGAAVAAGLWLAGSPAEQRLLRLDDQRVADLGRLVRLLNLRWQATESLPAALDGLVDGQRLSRIPLDPETDAPYEYRTTGPGSYELCAVFSTPSRAEAAGSFWSHGAGRQCFAFDVPARRGNRP